MKMAMIVIFWLRAPGAKVTPKIRSARVPRSIQLGRGHARGRD